MLDVWGRCLCVFVSVDASPSVLHLLKELVSRVLVAVLLHLGQVALLRGDRSVDLEGSQRKRGVRRWVGGRVRGAHSHTFVKTIWILTPFLMSF